MANDSLNDLVSSNNPANNVPKIYVACLAAYNAGKLHGRWIKVAQPIEDIYTEIQKMLSESPVMGAEEFSIHDYEGFGSSRLNEFESIESVQEKASFILEWGELGAELLVYYGNVEEARHALENRYHGEYEDQMDFAIQLFDECHMSSIPEAVQHYIDYAAFKRDLFLGDFFLIEVGGRAHIFAKG